MKAVTVYRHSTAKLSYFCSRVTDLIALLLTTYLLSLNIYYTRVEKKKKPHVCFIQVFSIYILMKEMERSQRTHAKTCALSPSPSISKQKQNKEKAHAQLRRVRYKLLLTYVILIQECSVNGFITLHLAGIYALCSLPYRPCETLRSGFAEQSRVLQFFFLEQSKHAH